MKQILRPTRLVSSLVLVLAAALVMAPGALAAPPVVQPPQVEDLSPLRTPLLGQTVTYSVRVTWGGPPRTLIWEFPGRRAEIDVSADSAQPKTYSLTHAHQVPGPMRVTVTAVNENPIQPIPPVPSPLTESDSNDVTVFINRRPVAAFVFNPVTPLIGQGILFASNSSDPDGDGLDYRWSFGDAVTSPLPSPTHSYSNAGRKTVTLTVIDAWNARSDPVSGTIDIAAPPAPPTTPAPANGVPSAAFAYSPRLPVAGQQVEFASSASDPEGQLREQLWDLDGDGQFDDARGDEVLYTFSKAGQKTVRLRVVDAAGKAAVRERIVAVTAAPRARAGFLSPFPVVRLNGEVRRRGAMVRLLSVKAPRGSSVQVRCSGKSCKVKKRSQTVRKDRVRFEAFERAFRAGTELEIFVRKRGRIGKYTKFEIRAGDAPERTDRCLPPGAQRPRRCGAT